MLTLLATVSPATTHPDTKQSVGVILAVLLGLGMFLLGCWIINKTRNK